MKRETSERFYYPSLDLTNCLFKQICYGACELVIYISKIWINTHTHTKKREKREKQKYTKKTKNKKQNSNETSNKKSKDVGIKTPMNKKKIKNY